MEKFSQPQDTVFGWKLVNGTSTNPNLKDYTQNGQYCESGLAVNSGPDTAKCKNATGIYQKDQLLDFPYECNPVDPDHKCEIKFDIDSADASYMSGGRGKILADCKCEMTGGNKGYCGSVIGTDRYFKAMRA